MNTSPINDIVVIGAGPAGLSCAIEAKRAGLSCLVVDKGGIANAIQHFQRDMFFFSTPELLEIGEIPFIVSTTRPTSLDCVNYYRRVTDHYNLDLALFEKIVSLDQSDDVFRLLTEKGTWFNARSLVIATGYYDCPNLLGVPGENLTHVTHYYRDPLPFYRQDVVIVGGKNSAVEAALDLYRHGARVSVVHRGAALSGGVKYWILPDFENRVADGSINLHLQSTIQEFLPYSTLMKGPDGSLKEIPSGAVFILIGYRPDGSFLTHMGIQFDPQTIVPVHHPETFETNLSNVYVAGGMIGGIYNNRVFIENGRDHAKTIIPAICRKHRLQSIGT